MEFFRKFKLIFFKEISTLILEKRVGQKSVIR